MTSPREMRCFGRAQIGENQLEELARDVGFARDAVHRDRRAAGRSVGEEEHRAQRVAGTLCQHNISAMARYCGERKAGFSLIPQHLYGERRVRSTMVIK